MDRAGRLVIPSEVRREAGIQPGTPLEVRLRDGVIEIQPKTIDVEFVRRGRFLVAKAKVPVPPLKLSTVEKVRRQLRASRGK